MSVSIKTTITKTRENFIAAFEVQNEMTSLLKKLNQDFLIRIKDKLENRTGNLEPKLSSAKSFSFLFFKYKEYDFYIRIALELGISVWLTPILREGNKFSVANDAQIKDLKGLLQFRKNEYNVFQNPNYTGWIICKNDFTKYSIAEKYDLLDTEKSELLIGKIIEEVTSFIECIKNNAKSDFSEINFNF